MLMAAFAAPAAAQFSRLVDEIEVKRLDFHPRPSWRNEIGSRIYGVIDLGLVAGRAEASKDHHRLAPNPDHRLSGIGPSFIGIRNDVALDSGWYAHAQLEHSFNADTGTTTTGCKAFWSAEVEHGVRDDRAARRQHCSAFWDRRSSVGLSHRRYGRIDIGRLEQPARQIAFMGSPWGPDSVASPGEGRLYLPLDERLNGLPGRSDQAISYQTPESPTYRLQLHASLLRRPTTTAFTAAGTADLHGASFEWIQGALKAGIGWQRWDDGSQSMPLAAVYTLGHWRAFGSATVGKRVQADFHNLFVGAAYRERSGRRPGEWRLGLNVFEREGQAHQWKLGAGYEYPFSRRTALQANVALRSSDPIASRVRVDVGFRHAFAL